jgi:outer membrane protein assembly factor BamB
MPSFELNLTSSPSNNVRGALASAAARDLRGALDVTLAGEILQAATSTDDAAYFLRDLLTVGVTVAEARAPKGFVTFHDAPWELCVAAGENVLLVSAYRTGAQPDVRVVDHPVSVGELVAQVRAAVDGLPGLDADLAKHLVALSDRLEASDGAIAPPDRGDAVLVRWRSRPRAAVDGSGAESVVGVTFQAVMPGSASGHRPESAHADLHGLLARGRVGLELRGRRLDLAQGFVFLQVERLVSLCRPLMEAWAARRAFHLRALVGDTTLALRLSPDEQLSVTVTRPHEGTMTVPALDPRSFVSPCLDAALALASSMARADRSLARNLRLRALRSEARALRRWLRDVERPDTRVNHDPTLYRAVTPASRPAESEPDIAAMSRLRYTQRWHAEIEGLDLAGTLLCGDRLIVPGSRELHALDRHTGAAVWSAPVGRAATTVAGDGILRLSPRGEVELRSVATGESLWTARVAPRVGAPAIAHTVCAPGLPRIVVLAEGERRLVALDLRTGEARWAWTSRHGGAFKMRRVGRLLVVSSGDASVSAIDLNSGELVWRYGGRVPFTSSPLVHREQVIAMAGEGSRGPARLHALDAYQGTLQWTADADAPACCAPVAAGDTVAVALATREGIVLAGYDAATGASRFRTPVGAAPGVYNARPAVTAFDDLVVVNLPTGRVVAVDARSGDTRWAQSFRAPVADDVPRRLDVQLRAGALFVPQSALGVLRPRDGAVLAQVDACDLVPDLVRVDEQCAIYIAEESGHIGCYELGTRLRVIRPV